jgi:hypothetical protein
MADPQHGDEESSIGAFNGRSVSVIKQRRLKGCISRTTHHQSR